MIVEIEYKDYGAQGEYGFFGKTIAKSFVAGWTDAMIAEEIEAMKAILGDHVIPVEVYQV